MADTDVTATLQAKWYKTLVSALGLDPASFQLLQPSSPLGDTSDQLWSYFNNIPPQLTTAFFSTSGGNRLYDDYKGVVSQLTSTSDGAFRNAMSDDYESWLSYVKALNPLPAPPQLADTFYAWANVNVPDKANRGRALFAAAANDTVFNANMAVQNVAGFKNNTPNWNCTIDDLTEALMRAERRDIAFDSSTANSDVTNTWAKGKLEGFYSIFHGYANGDYSTLSSKIANSTIKIDGFFEHVETFTASPGSWYNPAALSLAYNTRDNTLWRHGSPDWNGTFGATGNMNWFTGSLVVVDGIDITVTSQAGLDSEERNQFSAGLKAGFWPFFAADGSGGYSHDVTFGSEGAATVHITNPAGNPVILGANVVGAPSFFAGKS